MKDSCSDVLKNSCIGSPAHSSAVAQVMCWPVLSSSLHLYTAPLFYSMAPAPLLWHPKRVKFILLMTNIKHIIHKLAPSVCTEPRLYFSPAVCLYSLHTSSWWHCCEGEDFVDLGTVELQDFARSFRNSRSAWSDNFLLLRALGFKERVSIAGHIK